MSVETTVDRPTRLRILASANRDITHNLD